MKKSFIVVVVVLFIARTFFDFGIVKTIVIKRAAKKAVYEYIEENSRDFIDNKTKEYVTWANLKYSEHGREMFYLDMKDNTFFKVPRGKAYRLWSKALKKAVKKKKKEGWLITM